MSNVVSLDSIGRKFILASLVSSYPSEGFVENVRTLIHDMHEADEIKGHENLMEDLLLFTSTEDVSSLCSEYIDLFDRGREANSLYETEYGRDRSLVKGNQLADIAAFYQAYGLQAGGTGLAQEMLDHVAVELEFYAVLLLKFQMAKDEENTEGMEIIEGTQKKFLREHLARFVGAITERESVKRHPFYSLVFNYCKDTVYEECHRLGVEFEKEYWVPGQEATAEVACGGVVGGVK